MKSGLSASQAYIQVMEQESDESPIYMAIEEELDVKVAETPAGKHLAIPSKPWTSKAPFVFLSLALVASIVYSVIIIVDRNALNKELVSTQSVLTSTQSELNPIKQTLALTKTEISSTKKALDSTQVELGSTKDVLASTEVKLNSAWQSLASAQDKLLSIEGTLAELEAVEAKLRLYEDTLGIKIFSGIEQPPLRGASPIELINNPTATNPSWQQLISFLRADPTDDRTWTEGIFVSGDFGEMLHNNAEAAGIRAAIVGVFFEGETIGQGLNAFKTTDRGLVYMETQSDSIAYVTKGKEYGTISLGQNTALDYGYYEKMKADWNSYDQKLEAYNKEVKEYNKEIFGKVYYIGTTEWERIKEWERTLEDQKRVLDSLRAQLEYLGKPMGIVESIVIYW